MKKATYSNSAPTRFGTIAEAQERYRLSRKVLMQIAREAGAIIEISSRLKRIDFQILDSKIGE